MHPQTPEEALALVHQIYGQDLEKLCLANGSVAVPASSTTNANTSKSKKKRSTVLFSLCGAY
jgi:hypothetical protein